MMSVLLKKPFFATVTNVELVEQMEARKKSKKKLPTWFGCPNIYYPKKLHIEQTSSEVTAQYKSRIVAGKSLVDLTGGFGIDSYFFSSKVAGVFHCEINQSLSKIAQHNFEVLGADNILTIQNDGISFLEKDKERYDWLYVDPSRRDDRKGRVFQLSDCEPNVLKHLDLFFLKADNLLIKTSPLLDITKGISELKNVYQIHVVAVNNDMKELLWVLKKGHEGEIEVTTINFQNSMEQTFIFNRSEEMQLLADFSAPRNYLYEPNAAIMKSGGFKSIGEQFKLKKLHSNTHLYTSYDLVDFPGRRFKIEATIPYSTKEMKQLEIRKANVTIRNFSESVADVRKKHKILDGGSQYLFFTTDMDRKKIVILGSKIPYLQIT
ncbi:THUMP-like domain-containing protein [Aggregatimonas sangjinii]|nr:class I SAM-dependent methyltransferase [Aggregatimonas sangjinii]